MNENHHIIFTRSASRPGIRKLSARTPTIAAIYVAMFLGATLSHATQTIAIQPIMRSILDRRPIPGTRLEREVILVTFQPGVAAPPHHHTDAGFNYIIEGTAESAYGNEKPTLYHAGETFMDRTNTTHTIFINPDKYNVLKFLIVANVPINSPYTIVP